MKKILVTMFTALMLLAVVLPTAPEAQAQSETNMVSSVHFLDCGVDLVTNTAIDTVVAIGETGKVSVFKLGRRALNGMTSVKVAGDVEALVLSASGQVQFVQRDTTTPNMCAGETARLTPSFTLALPVLAVRPGLRWIGR